MPENLVQRDTSAWPWLQVQVIPLTQDQFALVDAADYELLVGMGAWHARQDRNTWYAFHGGRPMHKVLTGWPQTDHINGNGLDNRRCNLRPATHQQNAGNRRIPSNNTSGYKGVYRTRSTGKWFARIVVNDENVHLGTFDDKVDAALAYDVAAREAFGEYALLNFPDGRLAP